MKLLIAFLGIILSHGAFADDVPPTVTERVTCADMSSRISELGAISEPTDDETTELTKLKADYRKSCAKGARGRRTSADSRTIIESDIVTDNSITETAPVEETTTETELSDQVTESAPTQITEDITPTLTIEQELANLDAGLCADGSKPNRFGCCGDEIFKDLGDTVFACCPPDGGDCFPPLK